MSQATASPSQALRDAVNQIVRAHGVRGAREMLGGMSRECLIRLAAGVPVRAGTIALVTARLAELAEDAERCGASRPWDDADGRVRDEPYRHGDDESRVVDGGEGRTVRASGRLPTTTT